MFIDGAFERTFLPLRVSESKQNKKKRKLLGLKGHLHFLTTTC